MSKLRTALLILFLIFVASLLVGSVAALYRQWERGHRGIAVIGAVLMLGWLLWEFRHPRNSRRGLQERGPESTQTQEGGGKEP